jgi:prepilin-type N-terminal cleavage/methylation domain-containing protein
MKRGFTLVELLVYVAIMGFIIVVAGKAYSDATGMRVRTQSMTKATEEVNRIAELIKEDLSQMGAKAWISKNTQGYYVSEPAVEEVYISLSTGDTSSFNLVQSTGGNGYDEIEFKKISYGENGEYIGTRLIRWHVSGGTLYRSCKTTASLSIDDPEIDVCPAGNAVDVAMAENVKTFTLNPSKPLNYASFGGAPTASNPSTTFALLSRPPANAAADGNYHATTIDPPTQSNNNTATLKFSERNNTATEKKQHQVFVAVPNTVGTSFTNCKQFEFKKGETYAVKFKTPVYKNVPDSSMITLFQPGIDYMAVGFRAQNNGAAIAALPKDFMFYPPQEKNKAFINQYFEFSVSNDVPNACVAFTFAFYSGTNTIGPHKGKLQIRDFELLHKKDEAYEFVRDGSSYDKKNVKAFELILEVSKRNEVGSTRKPRDGEVGGYVIPVPNNGLVPL